MCLQSCDALWIANTFPPITASFRKPTGRTRLKTPISALHSLIFLSIEQPPHSPARRSSLRRSLLPRCSCREEDGGGARVRLQTINSKQGLGLTEGWRRRRVWGVWIDVTVQNCSYVNSFKSFLSLSSFALLPTLFIYASLKSMITVRPPSHPQGFRPRTFSYPAYLLKWLFF